MTKKLLLVLLIVMTVAGLTGCKKKETVSTPETKKLGISDFEKIVNGTNADIKYSIKLDEKTEGITSSKAKLVLVESTDASGKLKYTVCVAEYDNVKATLFNYGNFAPLKILQDEFIDSFSHAKQSNNMDIIFDFVEQYGINCFDNSNNCELYIKRLTKEDKLIDINSAKNAIINNIASKQPKLDIYTEFEIIFEQGSAVPEYYAFKDSDENGTPCWKAMDSDFFEFPSVRFDTLDELKNYLLNFSNPEIPNENTDVNTDNFSNESSTTEMYDSNSSDTHNDNTNQNREETSSPTPQEPAQNTEKVLYRVRKSADDARSQLGAFENPDNAKALADANKDAGYKVYDNSGNLFYTP